MKSIVTFFVVLAFVVGMPLYAENITVNASLFSLDLVVERSRDGKVHLIKNFDETYFGYSESVQGNHVQLVSNVQVGINTDETGKVTYHTNMKNKLVMADRAKVVVQVPNGVTIKFVSMNGSVAVNEVDCALIAVNTNNGSLTLNKSNFDSIELAMINGSISYTGKIEGKNIVLQTRYGNVSIVLEQGSDVDVDIQTKRSYTQHRGYQNPVSGVEITGDNRGRISNKRGSGVISAITQTGKIEVDVL